MEDILHKVKDNLVRIRQLDDTQVRFFDRSFEEIELDKDYFTIRGKPVVMLSSEDGMVSGEVMDYELSGIRRNVLAVNLRYLHTKNKYQVSLVTLGNSYVFTFYSREDAIWMKNWLLNWSSQ